MAAQAAAAVTAFRRIYRIPLSRPCTYLEPTLRTNNVINYTFMYSKTFDAELETMTLGWARNKQGALMGPLMTSRLPQIPHFFAEREVAVVTKTFVERFLVFVDFCRRENFHDLGKREYTRDAFFPKDCLPVFRSRMGVIRSCTS
jgi:hypothetical protein